MNQKKLIFKNSILITSVAVFERLQGFLCIAILTRLLVPSELGLFNLLQNLLMRFDNIGKFGIDCAIVRNGAQFKSRGPEEIGKLFGTSTILSTIIGILIALFIFSNRNFIAVNWIRNSSSSHWIAMIALCTLFTIIGNNPWNFLLAFREFKTHSINTMIFHIVRFIIFIGLTLIFGYRGAILGLLIIQFIYFFQGWLISIPKLKKNNIRLSTRNFFNQSISIFKLGLPFYSSNLILGIIDIPLLLLVTKFGGLSQMGYLRVADTLQQLITFLPNALSPLIINYLSRYVLEDLGKYFELKSIHFRILGVFTLIILILCQIMLEIIVPISFGESYQEALNLSRITLNSGFFITLSAILSQYIVSSGNTRAIVFTNLPNGILKIILAYLLIPKFFAYGYLISNLCFHFLNTIYFMFIASKGSKSSDIRLDINYILLSVASIAFVFFIINLDIGLIAKIVLGIGLNFLILYGSFRYIFKDNEKLIVFDFVKKTLSNKFSLK